MDTKDILLYESGDGGEISIQNDDIVLAETLYQQFYLAWFGGNVESVTRNDTLFTEEKYDYWANSLFWRDTPSIQFNSTLERILREETLNSSGRLKIEQAAKNDIAYLSNLLTSTVSVKLIDTNRVRISAFLRAKDNQEDKVLQLVYDNAKNELIIEKII